MANSTTMTYGDYEFSPVPFISVSKAYETQGNGVRVGATYTITLTGTLTPLGTPSATGGYPKIDELQDELKQALAENGNRWRVQCNGSTLIETYPHIKDVNFSQSNDNWVFTCPYTITLEYYDEPAETGIDPDITVLGSSIKSFDDSWTVEFVEDAAHYEWNLDGNVQDNSPYQMRMTRSISAVGKTRFTANPAAPQSGVVEYEAWENAKNYVANQLWTNDRWEDHAQTGLYIINMADVEMARFNHIRQQTIDEGAGSFSLQESWLLIDAGATGIAGNATEDFTITTTASATQGLTSISVEGSIQGLETRSYGTTDPTAFTIAEDKYAAATGYWANVEAKLYGRALYAAGVLSPSLNMTALDTSLGHNPTKGVITYQYGFDNRPCTFISGALHESIVISEDNPSDVFASLVVLGRAKGPILQDIGTVTATTRNIAIEVIMAPPTGCDGCSDFELALAAAPGLEVDGFLCCVETQINGSWDQVFKSADSESWDIKTGLYTRNVSWTMTQCSNDAPSTSFC
jgi:hypothetical protein